MTDNTQNTSSQKQKVRPPSKRKQEARRRFLRSIALTAGVTSISMLGIIPLSSSGQRTRLRPPGALNEKDYLAACIKCGQCVQVCPVKAIELDDMGSGFGLGAAYLVARDQACDFSCDGLQCVLACPTGALTHLLDYPADTRMGFAELSEPKECLAIHAKGFKGQARGADYQGLLRFDDVDRWNPIKLADKDFDLEICDLCVRLCPIEIRISQCVAAEAKKDKMEKIERVAEQHGNECPPEHAIRLEPISSESGEKRMKPVILDGCVGCGVCEMVCPAASPAITINYNKLTDAALPAALVGGAH
ncbi:MAG: 4Fe-4S binding protein [Pseudomonadota bacterium]